MMADLFVRQFGGRQEVVVAERQVTFASRS
jgi:hypothetical protein